jgi:ATP-binding cassette subfamily C protein EexD
MNKSSVTAGDVKDALGVCRQTFFAVIAFSGVANLLMLVPAFYMLNVYDKAVGNNSLSTLAALSVITAVLFIALGSMEALRTRLLTAASVKLDHLLGPDTYERTFHNAVNVGSNRANTRPLQDLTALRQFLTGNGILAACDAPWLPIYIIILFLFHPLLGWMGVLSAFAILCVALLNQRETSSTITEANHLAAASDGLTLRVLRNAEAAAAMGMLPAFKSNWWRLELEVLKKQEAASRKAAVFNALIKTLRLAIQSAAIGAGAYLVLKQEISPGMIIAGSILIGRALQPVELGVGVWKGFLDAYGQYQRLNEVTANIPLTAEKMSLPTLEGRISARNVAIVPPGAQKPTVFNINFDIPAGETVMLLGASGAGKSTLIRGVLGLWRTAMGELRLDGAEPMAYNRSEIGPQIGYLPQDIELLEGTVAENICRFSEVDSDLVVKAARDAGVHDFILTLQNGYDTVIGGLGGLLSPGERQRIALARALYNRPRLVVLDEPNSNLDEQGEAALHQAIRMLKAEGSTVILISHRKAVMPLADRIIFMANGTVVDSGPAADVVARLNAANRAQAAPEASNATDHGTGKSLPAPDGQLTPNKKPRVPTVTWNPKGEQS